jgi:hypothetical protein
MTVDCIAAISAEARRIPLNPAHRALESSSRATVSAVTEGWCPFDYERLDQRCHCKVCERSFAAAVRSVRGSSATGPERTHDSAQIVR